MDNCILEKYTIGNKIGHGGYGVVFRVKRKTDYAVYAMKVFAKRHTSTNHGFEYILLDKLKHENIVRLIEYIETDRFIYTVLEYIGETMNRWRIKHYRDDDFNSRVIRAISCVARAINHCHLNGYIYCDLKPSNVLIDGDEIKLCDFGAVVEMSSLRHTSRGTIDYMSPEMVQKCCFGPAHDAWCLGVLTYYLYAGFNPFRADSDDLTKERILTLEPDLSMLESSACDFISALLIKDSAERMSMCDAMEHEFMSGDNTLETNV